jgi:hypothetical protein
MNFEQNYNITGKATASIANTGENSPMTNNTRVFDPKKSLKRKLISSRKLMIDITKEGHYLSPVKTEKSIDIHDMFKDKSELNQKDLDMKASIKFLRKLGNNRRMCSI